jgi:acyl-CoA synthetase (AMP-forming)/AMP-acid ligase II/acyl carrier protein
MMSPTSFVKRPIRWLQAISDYDASVTVAPTFGYQWAAAKVTEADLAEYAVSLDRLQLAACGAEPIHLPILEQFTDRFASTGFRHEVFYPCYGLAESTLMVTGTVRTVAGSSDELPGPVSIEVSRSHLQNNIAADPESENEKMQIVSCGVAGKDTLLRILDPVTHQPCDDNQVGEIQVQSASVAAGYWNDPVRTDEVFSFPAHRNGSPSTQASLRTGDLGFLRDGHLFVTGRLKDLIIIGGQNHYPQDIERSVSQSHPRLAEALSATFSVDDGESVGSESAGKGPERLIVVHEVPRGTSDKELEDILRAIRMAIAQSHDLAVHEIVLIRAATLPRTSSGKVQRRLCRQLYVDGELNTILNWRHTDALDPALFPEISELLEPPQNPARIQKAIESTLLAWLKDHLDHVESADSEIHSDQSFGELGVDSLLAVELSQQLERWLGVRLSPVAAWSYPTPETLAKHLCSLVVINEADEVPESPLDNGYAELVDQISGMDEDEVAELLRNLN